MMDDSIEVNDKGGAGSKVPKWHLMDFRALDAIAQVFTEGSIKYAEDNWRAVSVEDHIKHGVRHAYKFMESSQQYEQGEVTDGMLKEENSELAHAACRLFMALAVLLQDEGVEDRVPKGLACTFKPVEPTGEHYDRDGFYSNHFNTLDEAKEALRKQYANRVPTRHVPRYTEYDDFGDRSFKGDAHEQVDE